MIAVIDYGVGNLFSLSGSLRFVGLDAEITGDPGRIKRADRIILPGVGAFADAAAKLRERGLDKMIIDEANSGKPLLGICLGMQMLLEKSYEYGEHQGLGLIKGSVIPLASSVKYKCKIPHMGWNSLEMKKPSELFANTPDGAFVYYVHSYCSAYCDESVTAVSDYGGIKVTGALESGNVYGVQFHPEKSGETGLEILKAFGKI